MERYEATSFYDVYRVDIQGQTNSEWGLSSSLERILGQIINDKYDKDNWSTKYRKRPRENNTSGI